uniref:Uncharacterized protein n=1 Tax=Oryza glumipatula TaxID=40148 RepID=A0A0D9YL35_9ORYZ
MGLGGGRNRKEGGPAGIVFSKGQGWVREGDVQETWGWMGMVQSAMVAQAKAETPSSGAPTRYSTKGPAWNRVGKQRDG